jgi:hypothetical protein
VAVHGATHAGALEFPPRLLLGDILINTAAWWCRLAIDANNAACGVFGAPTIADIVQLPCASRAITLPAC